MPILRHPSRGDLPAVAPVPDHVLEESGVRPASVRASRPPPLPSLVVPAPAPPPPSGVQGPRGTVRMQAVRPDDAPPSGRLLDSVDFVEPGRVALELGAQPGRPLQRPPTPPTAKTPASTFSPVGTSHVLRKIDTPDPRRPGIFAFAGFGLPPESFSATPAYALRVLMRKRVLRAGLAVARRQRSADVELYEAALKTADPDAYTKGILALVLGPILALTLVIVAAEILL